MNDPRNPICPDSQAEEDEYAETLRELVDLRSDESYLKLTSFYQRKTFWEIASISRLETSHSSFLAWLLNPAESHGLHTFALERLLHVVGYSATLNANRRWLAQHCFVSESLVSSLISSKFIFSDVTVNTEVVVDVHHQDRAHVRNSGRLDIHIAGVITYGEGIRKSFRIVIENKVLSREGDSQTQDYCNWVQRNRTPDEESLMLFLTPRSSYDLIRPDAVAKCDSTGFIEINYQTILDYIIEPAIMVVTNPATKLILEDYVRALSTPSTELTMNNKGKDTTIMAISSKERELLVGFFESNKPFLQKMCEAMAQSDDLDGDEDALAVANGVQAALAATRDNSKFTVSKGNDVHRDLGKGRMVLQVLKFFCNQQTDSATIDRLRSNEFILSGKRKLLMTNEEMQERIAASKNHEGERARYYTGNGEPVTGPGGVVYFVHTQWGLPNALKFIAKFQQSFPGSGITIQKQ